MDREEALAIIDAALARIAPLRRSQAQSPAHVAFVQSTGLELARIFGAGSVVARNFSHIRFQATGSFLVSMWDYEAEMAAKHHEAYLLGLDMAEGILTSAKEQLLSHGVDRILRGSRIRSEGAKVFITHGTEGPALEKLERFIRALGLQPVIVVREASRGMAVDDLVEKHLKESDCAVILATADEEVGDRRQPRPNVIHEIGLAQEIHPEKIIYLKERGCDFPSNVKPKVWGSFAQDNMEEAFEKVSKELRAMGLL